MYLSSARHMVTAISGLPMSTLDIRYMLDMAMYLAVFGIFVLKVAPRLHPWLASTDRQGEIVGVGMGLHLANYFWSGAAAGRLSPSACRDAQTAMRQQIQRFCTASRFVRTVRNNSPKLAQACFGLDDFGLSVRSPVIGVHQLPRY